MNGLKPSLTRRFEYSRSGSRQLSFAAFAKSMQNKKMFAGSIADLVRYETCHANGDIEIMLKRLRDFLDGANTNSGKIDNERALQLEIGMMFRQNFFDVQFEKSCHVLPVDPAHTKKQKRDLDLLVSDGRESLAIELKAPFSGRVPETVYDFYTDVAFVESIVHDGIADRGDCLIVTNDPAYWSGRKKSGIYQPLRVGGSVLSGIIDKPTGKDENSIVIAGTYHPIWQDIGNQEVLGGGRYILLEVPVADGSEIKT